MHSNQKCKKEHRIEIANKTISDPTFIKRIITCEVKWIHDFFAEAAQQPITLNKAKQKKYEME